MLGAGVFGAAMTGIILDKTQAYKRLILICIAISMVAFMLIANNLLDGGTTAMLRLICFILGLVLIPVIPASLGLGIELTFPLQPSLVNGSMYMFAQIQTTLQGLTYSSVMDVDPTDYATATEVNDVRKFRAMLCCGLYLFVILISFGCFVFVKEDLKRLHFKNTTKPEA